MKILLKAQKPKDKTILFDFKQFSKPDNIQRLMRERKTQNFMMELLLNSTEVKEVKHKQKQKAEAQADLVIGESYSSRRLA